MECGKTTKPESEKKEIQLIEEFVDIRGCHDGIMQLPELSMTGNVAGNEEILFARFLIVALLLVSEPKMNSEQYAERLGVSRTNFFSHLKTVSEERPFAILTKLRICIAKQLLANTDRKVNEIAIDVGKENTDYFSSFFKRQTGMTPMEYRSKWQSGLLDSSVEKLGVVEICMAGGNVWDVNLDKFAERLPLHRSSYLKLVREL